LAASLLLTCDIKFFSLFFQMGCTLYAYVVASTVLAACHMGGSSDLKQLSPHMRNKFIGEVLLGIAKKQHITTDTHLDDITFDVDRLTSVVFKHLHLLDTEVGMTRIVGDYEIDNNDVLQTFPRSGHLNVTFHELLKEVGLVSLVSSRQLPDTGLHGNHSINLDALVDFILLIVRETLRETGQDQIRVPDMDKSFATDTVFFPVSGRFRAEGGWLRNLSTVHRTTDTIAMIGDTTISVVCGFRLQTMEFGFNHFEANLGRIKANGALTGTVPYNSINAKVGNKLPVTV
jgi:hypothetical protein